MELTFEEIKEFVKTKVKNKTLFNKGYYYWNESEDLENFTMTFVVVDNFRDENILEEIFVDKKQLMEFYKI